VGRNIPSSSCGNGVALFVEDMDALNNVSFVLFYMAVDTYKESASKPEASRDEGESLSRLPLVTNSALQYTSVIVIPIIEEHRNSRDRSRPNGIRSRNQACVPCIRSVS
jgi:hypothetical protein